MNNKYPLNSAPVLQVKGLTTILGGRKIIDISELNVWPNETLMIIGPNGSGKTTLLLSMALLLKPSTGIIKYHGVKIDNARQILAQRRRIAVVLQEPLLLNSSVMDNVTLGLKLRKVPRPMIHERAIKWLERFGVDHLAKRQARTLSGGEARRVSLARAFALEPEILFLDEPFIALDSPTKQALLEDFEDVIHETKSTVVMVTHDRNEALTLGERVAVIMNGTIRQYGTTDEIFTSPVDEEIANFVEAGNILRGIITAQENGLAVLNVNGVNIQVATDLPVGTETTGYMHYDDVTLYVNEPAAASSARNHLKGYITRIISAGAQIKVFVDCGFKLVALITRRSWQELGLEVGMEIQAVFKATSIHLIPRHTAEADY